MKLHNVICVCVPDGYLMNMIFTQKSTQTFESLKTHLQSSVHVHMQKDFVQSCNDDIT